MKLPNWRHCVLFLLMAAGLIATGAEVESESTFYLLKAIGLSCLLVLNYLSGRWRHEGKIKS